MAKHNIEATSTVCGAASHSWLPSLATNYRTCGRCRTVEVLINGQWVSPTGRVRRSRLIAPTLPWTQGFDDGDQQVKVTRLVEMPTPSTVKPLNTFTVSPSVETGSKSVMTRRELGEKLFDWGTEHGYPQLSVRVPARTHTIANEAHSQIQLSERIHTIAAGVGAWRSVCFQCPQSVVEAALEQVKSYKSEWPELPEEEKEHRLALIEYGRARGWRMFSFKSTKPEMRGYQFTLILGGDGEQGWMRFASCGDYDQICQACELLERDQQGENARIIELPEKKPDASITLDGVRKWLLGDGQRFGYPAIKFRVEGDGVVYKLVGNETSYRERAEQSSLLWLWNACWAIDYWSKH